MQYALNTHQRCLLATLLLLLSTTATRISAHELQDNRATLVLRDKTHVSITVFLDYADVLHRVLAPERSIQDFVLFYSGLPANSFKTALDKAQDKLRQQTTATTVEGQPAILDRWIWPDASEAQHILRQRAMQALVAPNDHGHSTQLEVRCELSAPHAITTLQVVFPKAFQRVLLVSYQPRQKWSETSGKATAVTF